MATIIILKKQFGVFIPADKANDFLFEQLKENGEYKAVITKPRNLLFHKKLFALINIAYKAWEPVGVVHKGVAIQKNLDVFRDNLTIMAGFSETTFNLKGELRLVAKSISFAKMDEVEFERLYGRFIDVILGSVLTHYKKSDLDEVVDRVLSFC